MSGHTPGPWRAVMKPVGECVYVLSEHETCHGGHAIYSEFIEPLRLQVHGRGFDHSCKTAKAGPPAITADARLIAAAPDLLETLREAVALLRTTPLAGVRIASDEWLDRATEIVAKAEGRA